MHITLQYTDQVQKKDENISAAGLPIVSRTAWNKTLACQTISMPRRVFRLEIRVIVCPLVSVFHLNFLHVCLRSKGIENQHKYAHLYLRSLHFLVVIRDMTPHRFKQSPSIRKRGSSRKLSHIWRLICIAALVRPVAERRRQQLILLVVVVVLPKILQWWIQKLSLGSGDWY